MSRSWLYDSHEPNFYHGGDDFDLESAEIEKLM
jgi:hypothetical protein